MVKVSKSVSITGKLIYSVKYSTFSSSRSLFKTFKTMLAALDFVITLQEYVEVVDPTIVAYAINTNHPIQKKGGWSCFIEMN